MALVNALDEDPSVPPLSRSQVDPALLRIKPRHVSATERAAMLQHLVHLAPGFDPSQHRLVLVNPNAGDMLPQRRWPRERYLQVIRLLLERYEDIYVLLTGSENERKAVREMVREIRSPRCVSVAGAFNLPDMVRVLCG